MAHQSQSSTVLAPLETEQKKADDTGSNWFGESLKSAGVANNSDTAGGVGKYLKRARETAADASAMDEPSKKRKVGWGDFSGW